MRTYICLLLILSPHCEPCSSLISRIITIEPRSNTYSIHSWAKFNGQTMYKYIAWPYIHTLRDDAYEYVGSRTSALLYLFQLLARSYVSLLLLLLLFYLKKYDECAAAIAILLNRGKQAGLFLLEKQRKRRRRKFTDSWHELQPM